MGWSAGFTEMPVESSFETRQLHLYKEHTSANLQVEQRLALVYLHLLIRTPSSPGVPQTPPERAGTWR